jgi:glycosyltransferase involved in cell wall biosynthesis
VRVLIATPFLPWPLNDGGKTAQFRTLESLRGSCEFTAVVPFYSQYGLEYIETLRQQLPHVRVVPAICFSDSGRPSLLQRYARFASRCWRLLNVGQDSKSVPSGSPSRIPYYPFWPLPGAFIEAIERELSNGHDIFQAEFSDMVSLGAFVKGRLPTVFVQHQIHAVYANRLVEADEQGNPEARYLADRMSVEEAAFLSSYDAVVAFSDTDRDKMLTMCPGSRIDVSPFPAPADPVHANPTHGGAAFNYAFVASENHQPNVDGLIWFIREVWPRIRNAQRDASLEVIGNWTETAKSQVPGANDIKFTGFVENLSDALQGRIMVVPLWVGSGIRTKILAAWSIGCPVVTTTIGAEGLNGVDGEHFLVGDSPAEFATACMALGADSELRTRLAAGGLDLVRSSYSLDAVRKTRLSVYEALLRPPTVKALLD